MNPKRLRAVLRPTLLAIALGHSSGSFGQDAGLALKPSHDLPLPSPHPVSVLGQPMPPGSSSPLTLARSETLRASQHATNGRRVHWASQATQWLPGQNACDTMAPPAWDRLTLSTALALNLCKSPALRQALATVAELEAGVTLAEVAQRPRWSATAGANAARNFVTGATNTRSANVDLGLSWVLFDFGAADANTANARQTLAAALATQSNTTLESVRELVQRYGEAVVAHAALQATTDAEATAQLTAEAAQARYDAGAGNQIDRLQALTALAQATLAQVRAQSDWENARGQLALTLGADIAQPLQLADWEAFGREDMVLPAFADLRAETQATHPRLRAVNAQIEGLKAQLASVQAASRGSLSLSTNVGHTRNWGISGTNATNVTNIPSASIGLSASIPIFNGTDADAQQAQVMAQTSARQAERESIQRDIDIQLWQAHRAVITSAKSLEASERLLAAAARTHEVAQGRYRAGVGSMVDLLTAQSALADGKRQRVVALVERITALTNLSLAAGRIGGL